MSNESIFHFVGFVSRMDRTPFIEEWSQYAKGFSPYTAHVSLQEKMSGNGKFNYLSRHMFTEEDFRFSFVTGRDSGTFPEQRAKVLTLGGYSIVGRHVNYPLPTGGTRIFIFFAHSNYDLETYRDRFAASQLNTYEAFFENCSYSAILEVTTTAAEARLFAEECGKRKDGVEISFYQRCPLPSTVTGTAKKSLS